MGGIVVAVAPEAEVREAVRKTYDAIIKSLESAMKDAKQKIAMRPSTASYWYGCVNSYEQAILMVKMARDSEITEP